MTKPHEEQWRYVSADEFQELMDLAETGTVRIIGPNRQLEVFNGTEWLPVSYD